MVGSPVHLEPLLSQRIMKHIVSIIAPCRNEAIHIRTFLNGVAAQECTEFSLEVLIADGGSTDGTREIISEYARQHPAIKMIDNKEGIVSTGLNAAIREARGEIVIRMDVLRYMLLTMSGSVFTHFE